MKTQGINFSLTALQDLTTSIQTTLASARCTVRTPALDLLLFHAVDHGGSCQVSSPQLASLLVGSANETKQKAKRLRPGYTGTLKYSTDEVDTATHTRAPLPLKHESRTPGRAVDNKNMSAFNDVDDHDELSSLPDDLWECLIGDGGDEEAGEASSITTAPESVTSTASVLQEKLALIEQGESIPTEDLIGEIKSADHADLDAILANEMSGMSITEKSKTIEKVHGVDDKFVEEPEFVKRKLEELDQCVNEIQVKDAYDRAYYMNPDYVMDPKLRLVILRCEEWEPKPAAKRLVNFYELKYELFPSPKVCHNNVQRVFCYGSRFLCDGSECSLCLGTNVLMHICCFPRLVSLCLPRK